jgi:hypothetical protein
MCESEANAQGETYSDGKGETYSHNGAEIVCDSWVRRSSLRAFLHDWRAYERIQP